MNNEIKEKIKAYYVGNDIDKIIDYITNLQEKYEEADNDRHKLFEQREEAREYIKKSLNNPQPFYEYIFGDEDGRVVNLDKLLNILQGDE